MFINGCTGDLCHLPGVDLLDVSGGGLSHLNDRGVFYGRA